MRDSSGKADTDMYVLKKALRRKGAQSYAKNPIFSFLRESSRFLASLRFYLCARMLWKSQAFA